MRLDTLTLSSSNLSRSRAFYNGKLGFRVLSDGDGAFIVDAGGVKLQVGLQSRDSSRTQLQYAEPRLVFDTRELARRCLELRDLGVSVDGPRKSPEGQVAELADPDGHPIVLWEK